MFSLDKSSLVSLFVESVLWGLFECLYMITLYLLLQKRSNIAKNAPYIIFVTIMFALCTTHAIISFLRLLHAFVGESAEYAAAYLANMTDTLYRLKYGFLFIEMFLSDALIVLRCFHLWDQNYMIVVLPALLSLGTLVSAAGTLHAMVVISNAGITTSPQVTAWMTASYTLAFITKVICLGLVVFRVRQIHSSITANINRHVKVYTVLLVLIESGFLSLLTTLILLPTVVTQDKAHYIMCDASSPVTGLTVGFIICGMSANLSNTAQNSTISSRAAGIHRFSIAPSALPQRPKKSAAADWNEYDEEAGLPSPTLSNSPTMRGLKGAIPLPPPVAL